MPETELNEQVRGEQKYTNLMHNDHFNCLVPASSQDLQMLGNLLNLHCVP
jgi:hypothetical protein